MSKVIALGMHRSGTSLVSSIIAKSGFKIAPSAEGNIFNVGGYFEDAILVRKNDSFLRSVNCSWDNISNIAALKGLEKEVRIFYRDILLAYENENTDFVIKDPRIALFLPYIEDLLVGYKFVFCVRSHENVSKSLLSRNGLEPHKVRELKNYYDSNIEQFLLNKKYFLIDYDSLIDSPVPIIKSLFHYLSREYDENLITNIMDRKSLRVRKIKLLPKQIYRDVKRAFVQKKSITFKKVIERLRVYAKTLFS